MKCYHDNQQLPRLTFSSRKEVELMKKLLPACITISLAMITLISVNAAIARFNGTWILNRSKSEGLTGALANAEIILVVTQDNKKLVAEQKIRVRGREQPSQPLIYNLDGSETTVEVVRPLAGTMHLQAKVLEKGQVLSLRSSISGENRGKEVAINTKEYWELAEGGRVLKITRVRETPEKTQQFKLYFEKQ
jgi:hypothetical protein